MLSYLVPADRVESAVMSGTVWAATTLGATERLDVHPEDVLLYAVLTDKNADEALATLRWAGVDVLLPCDPRSRWRW